MTLMGGSDISSSCLGLNASIADGPANVRATISCKLCSAVGDSWRFGALGVVVCSALAREGVFGPGTSDARVGEVILSCFVMARSTEHRRLSICCVRASSALWSSLGRGLFLDERLPWWGVIGRSSK